MAACAGASSIPPLRELFLDLDGELSEQEVKKIKGVLMGNQLPKRKLEDLENANDIFLELEQRGVISESNLQLLLVVFRCLKRRPLKDKILTFLEEHGHRTPRQRAEVAITVDFGDDFKLQVTKKMSKEEAMAVIGSVMQSSVKSWTDVPEAKSYIEQMNGVTCERVQHSCLEFFVRCTTEEGLQQLWAEYVNGKLQTVFQNAIINAKLLKATGTSEIPIVLAMSDHDYLEAKCEISDIETRVAMLEIGEVKPGAHSIGIELGQIGDELDERPLDMEMLHKISHSITRHDARRLARILGIKAVQTDTMFVDSLFMTVDFTYNMLKHWILREGKRATRKALAEALQKARLYHLLEIL
ncbi:uncharacterized protein LOC144444282 [Glandiceps talaboti]